MKTQSVSTQNFQGNIIFADKCRTNPERMLENYLKTQIGEKYLNKINKIIEEKPFDVFIYRNEARPDSLNIVASESFEDVLLGKFEPQYVTVKNNNELPKQLTYIVDAVQKAVNSYSKFLERKSNISNELSGYSFTTYKQ